MPPAKPDRTVSPLTAEARVLGQLLAAQNVLPVLPTGQRVAEFYAVALTTVPGVRGARVCLDGARSVAGDLTGETCSECVTPRSGTVPSVPTFPPRFRCSVADLSEQHVLPLRTTSATYGFFVIRVADRRAYEQYAPFIANIGSFLALWLENQSQQNTLRRARDALEQRVQERTAQLRATNLELQKEIDERRRAEMTIRDLNQDLERRVRDRTRELEAANEDLEAFAYSVSHDLRAPLRHMLGFAEALGEIGDDGPDDGGPDDRRQHYLAAIQQAGHRMATLIDDLLEFSRMGRTALAQRPVDLGVLVRDVIAEFGPETRGRAVRWQLEDLPRVIADQRMLRVILANLIGNALKFTRGRRPAEITIGRRPAVDRDLIIYVRDNGVGFDMAHADRLFGVFERLDPGGIACEGNGIGLAIVRRAVERLGGRVWAEAAVDQGATFCFSLPEEAAESRHRSP